MISKKIKKLMNKFSKYFSRHKKNVINGKNNIINKIVPELEISIYGDNNSVYIDENIGYFKGSIHIGLSDCPCNNCVIQIGKNSCSSGTYIRLMEDESKIIIGDDCLISEDVKIWCTDTHSIIDCDGNLLNKGKFIEIENHVWISTGVSILKNSKISANSVVGLNSVIAKEFEEKNVVIVGNPAKIVKHNVNWSYDRPNNYLKE